MLDCADGDTLPGCWNKTKEDQRPDDFPEQSHHTPLGLSHERKMYFHFGETAVMFGLPSIAAKTHFLINLGYRKEYPVIENLTCVASAAVR